MSADQIADRGARLAAQTIFDRPLLLEAGAGTGKTTTLVARALSWCLGPGWEEAATRLEDQEPHKIAAEVLQGVVAITFTEVAAAEMAARVAESLARVVEGREQEIKGLEPTVLTPDDAATRRWRSEMLLGTFDHLTVSTIHSFCFSLLTDHPLQAGLHPDLRVDADGSEIEAVARVAVERRVQEAYRGGEDSPFLVLASRGIGPGELLDAVIRWISIGAPLSLLERDPLAPDLVETYLDGLRGTVESMRTLIGDRLTTLPAGRRAAKVGVALQEAGELLAEGAAGGASLTDLTERLHATWTADDTARLNRWRRSDFTGEERDRLAELGEALPQASGALRDALRQVDRLDPELLCAARHALLPMVRQIERDLRARGVITFSGLLRESQALLRGSPAVVQRLRQRLKLLLVDEFQDTDPVQSEIIRTLALEGDPADCPSLFVVGDPKQSIYGWRDADLAAYDAFEELIRSRGGEKYTLSVNFRSAQEILDEVERAVSPVMRPEAGLQPPFRALQAAPGDKKPAPFRTDHWREIEYWVSWRPDPSTDDLGPGTVLFRKTRAQPRFLEEFRRLGIPFAVNRDRNYYQRREVIDAAAWVRAIINPADHLALLTLLRSITVGVPDAALIPLWTRSFPQLVTELRGPDAAQLEALRDLVTEAAAAVPGDIPGLEAIAGWEQSLVVALSSLARLRHSYRHHPPDRFVGKLRRELLVEASEAARFQGKFRLANLQRFFRQLESALEGDAADVHSILRALRLGVRQAREAEEAVPRDAVEEAVQVMTIHTAKGLEFAHVYLVQMHSGTGGGGGEPLDAREITPEDWEYQLFGASTLFFDRAEEKSRRIGAAEAVRTLYVALTRASERLVLVGSWPVEPVPVEPADAKSYIQLLQNRTGLPDSLTSLANDTGVRAREGYFDHDGIRWRFLGSGRALGARRRPRPRAAWLPDRERLMRNQYRYQLRRAAAEERMNRRLQAAVTAGVSDSDKSTASGFRDDTNEPSGPLDLERSAAMAIGTALHHCLENWNFAHPMADEIDRQLDRLPGYFQHPPAADALQAATDQLRRLADGDLLPRLQSLEGHFIGREVPVILTPEPIDTATDRAAPVGCFAGSIDLLYRDPSDGELIVADFKTDRLTTAEEIRQRAADYALQQQRYARAVQEAFDLDRPPRTELWFLWSDQIWSSSEETRR